MVIRFLKRSGIYNPGEVAGFNSQHEEKVARDFVARGVAEELEQDEKTGEWVPVERPEPEPNPEEGDGGKKGNDLTSLKKDELVAMAKELELEVKRADGQDGEPTKDDYVAAITEALGS